MIKFTNRKCCYVYEETCVLHKLLLLLLLLLENYQHQKDLWNVMCRGKKPKKSGRSKLQTATAIILWFAAH